MESKAEILIGVEPPAVWRVLGSAAERARVTPALPPGVLDGPETGREEGSLLRFAWGGSVVELSLEAEKQEGMPPADFTRVRVIHTDIPADGLPASHYTAECWNAAWTLFLRNLKGWAERCEAPGGFDYALTSPPVIQQALEMDAPPDRIWRALTDPALRRRWLPIALGEVLEREEGVSVTFAFTLEPYPSQVNWRLEPVDGGQRTRVHLRHEGLKQAYFDHDLGWFDFLVALWQETARPLIRITEWMAAPPERVWRFLSSQAGMRRWFNADMTFEPVLGGKVYFEAHGGKLGGRVVALEPNRKMAFSWTEYEAGYPEAEPLLLTLELTPEQGGTRVTLTHSGWENLPESMREREWAGYRRGWAKRTGLLSLKQAVEGETGAA